ncbi:hypothetical protein QTP86_001963 [Hemibagrus guttatus]|nr:hypothetical protein QTP86_001963 [Hemibagrus guttatus]
MVVVVNLGLDRVLTIRMIKFANVLSRMPFLTQPSLFIQTRDWHRSHWTVTPIAKLSFGKTSYVYCHGRPAPTDYEWVVTQNNITTHYKGITVVLQDVKRNTYVSCIAINPIGRGESKQIALTVQYPPSILPGTFCSMENRLLKCVCQAVAKPNAVISWTIDGSSELSSAFNTITLDNSSMTVSELTGPQGWGGNVTCTATNIAGTKVFQMYINSEGVDSLVLEAGVGAACVLGIIGLVTAIVICKKRRCAEPPKDLITVQQVRFDRSKVSHDYGLSSDEDLYVNAVQATQKLKEQNPSKQARPGRLAVINGTMNSAVYQKILKENVRPSVCDLKLKRTWVLQQDNDPKHTSKSTSEWLKKNKMKALEWPSQSPDLNPIEMLWHDLKKVVHARKPSNVAELQQFCKDERTKIPPQRCNRLIASYGKRLTAVAAAKGGPTSY